MRKAAEERAQGVKEGEQGVWVGKLRGVDEG